MVNGDGLTLVVPDLSGRLAVVTGRFTGAVRAFCGRRG
jgi:hypothetical protein